MRPYCLAPHVYACASDEGAVFLNVDTDAYVGIDSDQARALGAVVQGWPGGECVDVIGDEVRALAQVLCERGLLTRTIAVQPVERELVPWEDMPWRHIGPGHVLRFVWALTRALVAIRFSRFANVVGRRRSARRSAEPVSLERLELLLSAFFHIRAFFYAPKGRCLLDSLTLLEFLDQYGQVPQWVVGVQMTPFGSHSWLQHGDAVLNGSPEYVRAYTPILVV